ncbi:MAG: STAS domain-containing protein [Solirubrobacteraceae bacterium]
MAAGLIVEPQQNGVFFLAGELSLAEAPILERALADVLATATSTVVVDLGGVEFIDSTGLSVLVHAQQQASERGVQFGVRNPRAQAQRLLSLTGLEERLTIADPSAATSQD